MSEPAQRFYGQWARLYDRLADLPGLRSWRARTADFLGLSAGDTVVEMGCGTGANVPHLRDRVGPSGRVVGIDLTREMLARARTHPERVGRGVDYVQADATRPPVDDADAVLATFVVGMFDDPAPAVERWCDLVGPGGRVALLNFQRSDGALAVPLNLAFEGFVRLSAPGARLSRSSHATTFEKRVTRARKTLAKRTEQRRFETFAGGYLGVLAGRVE
ncbi:class I SAM-dependent methyltransferase [Salinibaculum rarum]|uniref:class I SAM-dependent methyltransferase n=1 Tax=Salinibaculum rarum TaxID=3058903 RepID=UPI00265DB408|nr:methyltransferase domain-containing protein [Salinibaculum sp. KK48]